MPSGSGHSVDLGKLRSIPSSPGSRLQAMTEPLLPVWIAFPKIPWGSVGWRMGAGEDYWHRWATWFKGTSPSARAQYKAAWPEPEGWEDFYSFIETDALPGWFQDRQAKIAEAAVPPQSGEQEIRGYHRVLWLLRQHFKRVRVDRTGDEECIAEIYVAPDGTHWRLSAHATQGGMHFTKLDQSPSSGSSN